jgi:tetratricopeptide (TPR) repeat protein
MKCEHARQSMMDRLFDALSADQAEKLDAHLQTCSQCAGEWEEVRQAHAFMAEMKDTPLPEALEAKVLQAAHRPQDIPSITPRKSRWPRYAAAASFLLIVSTSVFVWMNQPTPFTGMENKESGDALILHAFEESKATEKNMALAQSDMGESITDASTTRAMAVSGNREDHSAIVRVAMIDSDFLVTVPSHPDDAMSHDPGPHPDDAMARQPKGLMSKSFNQAIPSQSMKADPSVTIASVPVSEKMRAQPAVSQPGLEKSTTETAAKEYFETGLKLYNTAFTKVGNEQKALLESAVIFLSDLKSKFPAETRWLALSLILKADVHKQLGQHTQSVQTYQEMIRHFYDMEPYCLEARASIVSILASDPANSDSAILALHTFESLYPKSTKYADLALAIAETISQASPEEALPLCQNVLQRVPASHPGYSRASRLHSQIEKRIEERFFIKDFWFLGPVDTDTPVHDTPFDLQPSSEDGPAWHRPFAGQTGSVDVTDLNYKPNQKLAAYAVTFIHSPVQQEITFQFIASYGLRLWLNDNPIIGMMHNGPFDSSPGLLQSSSAWLNPGWNKVRIKTYPYQAGNQWKFILKITDPNGRVATNIKIDPTRGGEVSQAQ